jgi:hypothetical protein
LSDGRLLDAGGFLIDSDLFKELKSFDKIVKEGNAIIVAEGGMGKSYVLQEFCKSQQDPSRTKLFELVTYGNNASQLESDIRNALLTKACLFLDGLDEAVAHAGLLSRILKDIGTHVHVVIASRGIPQLKSLSDQLQWPMFSLLPYSRENVKELCLAANVEYDAFMRTVDRQNLGAICSKPLGCQMLIPEYRKTSLKNFTTEKLWRTSLENLCAENQESATREYVHDRPIVTVEEGFRIATIAALALKLSGHALLSRISDKPPQAGSIDSSRLFSNRDDKEAFNALLLHPLFLYVDKDCYRFAHSSYEDFLAAQGVMAYLNEKEWARIVLSPEGVPYPQWEGVIPWLAAQNDDILEKTKKSRPDLLLGTDALVDKLGADDICQAILEHADQVSSSVRESPSVQSRYYALNTDKCAKVIRKILKTAASDEVIDTAIDIISRARLSSLADVLVDVFCDETRDRSLRISAGYTLVELATNSQRRACKKVLKGPMAKDLKGIVARMAWPNLMSVEELIALLDSKHGKETDSFSLWLEHGGFVASLSRLPSKDKFKLLDWAVSGIQKPKGVLDCIAEARRAIFLHCWKEERSAKFVPLLAKGIVAYGAIYRSPFAKDDFEWHDSNHIFSFQDFCNDSIRRREVAKFIVEKPQFLIDAVCHCWIRLLGSDDGVFVETSLNATTEPQIRERWAKCLLHMGYMQLPEKAQLWDQMHREFPSVFTCNSEETLSESRKRKNELATMQRRFTRTQEKREENNKRILVQNVAWAHEVLQKGAATGKFVPLANVLIQQMRGDTVASFFDVRTSTLWVSFSEAERRNLVEAAYDFLLKSKGPWSGNQKAYPIYTQALCLLFACGRDLLDKMPVRTWKKVAPELLHYLFENFELISSTILHFKEKHPKACLSVLQNYYTQQFRSNGFWEIQKGRRFLSDTEFIRLLRSLDEDSLSDDLKYALYGKFMEADYGLAANYVKNKYASVPLRNLELRTSGCVLLAAPNRFPEFLRELASDVAWGMHWAETLLSEGSPHHARMANILPRLSIRNLTEFYSWLNIYFPPEKAPYHEGVFTPDATDNLYDFKSLVFTELMSRVEPEAVAAIEDLQRRFPKGNWFHDCALRLRNQLEETKCPTFSMDKVCKLLEYKKRMQVIHSADDLLQVIIDSLSRYQIYLTGVDAPQGRFLWNEHKGYVTHKSEEDVSDHLKAFLSKDLPSIVSNREVQLNRGRKGQSGSITDIWINAIADNMSAPLSLCIEVKGSWNQTAKTAFKTQLVAKYMDEGGANAGIFLVGWFESEREKKKTRIGKKENIAKLLEEQEQGLVGEGYKVKHVILDCSSCLPPVSDKKSRNTRKKGHHA